MTTGNPHEHLATPDLVAEAYDLAGHLRLGSLDQLTALKCSNLLFALAARFASDPRDLHEPRSVPDAEFAKAYADWAHHRCVVERERVLGIAARRVLGDSTRGRRGCAHFRRSTTTEEDLRAALNELQEISASRLRRPPFGN